MKRAFVANIVGIGTILALGVAASASAAEGLPSGTVKAAVTSTSSATASPSPSPSVSVSPSESPTPTVTPDPEPGAGITADIRVEIDLPSFSFAGPMVFAVNGVPVDGGVELPSGTPAVSNPSHWCGDASVDVAADLSSITVTGGEDFCNFEEAYVIVTLHGGAFGTVTLGADNLFEPASVFSPDAFVSGSGGGGGALSAGLHTAVVATPTLQYATTSGAVFEAYWLGTSATDMSGSATFNIAAAEQAEGAEPVAGDPNFTG